MNKAKHYFTYKYMYFINMVVSYIRPTIDTLGHFVLVVCKQISANIRS